MLQQVTKKIAQQIFYGNYFIAFGAFCLALEPFIIKKSKITSEVIYYAFLIFFNTHFAYHFHRFFGVRLRNNSSIKIKRHEWYDQNQNFQKILSIISILIAAIFLFKIGLIFINYLLPAAFLSAFYNFKIGNFKGLRHIPLIKTMIIAAAWGLSFSVPLLYFNFEPTEVGVFFIRYFLFIYAITLPFDIRDLNRDPKWLKTLPQLIGVKKTKFVIILLCLFSALTIIWFDRYLIIAEILVLTYIVWLLKKTQPESGDKIFLIGFDFAIVLKVGLIFILYSLFGSN